MLSHTHRLRHGLTRSFLETGTRSDPLRLPAIYRVLMPSLLHTTHRRFLLQCHFQGSKGHTSYVSITHIKGQRKSGWSRTLKSYLTPYHFPPTPKWVGTLADPVSGASPRGEERPQVQQCHQNLGGLGVPDGRGGGGSQRGCPGAPLQGPIRGPAAGRGSWSGCQPGRGACWPFRLTIETYN